MRKGRHKVDGEAEEDQRIFTKIGEGIVQKGNNIEARLEEE